MTRGAVVGLAALGASLAALLGIWLPWWCVLFAEVAVATGSAWASYTLTLGGPEVPEPVEAARDAHAEVAELLRTAAEWRANTMTDREFRAHFNEAPLGMTFTDLKGPTLYHMEGDEALRAVGATKDQWEGSVLPEPWLSAGFTPASQGVRAPFVADEPYGSGRDQLVEYLPLWDAVGRITGVKIWWWIPPKGWRIKLIRPDGTEVPRVEV